MKKKITMTSFLVGILFVMQALPVMAAEKSLYDTVAGINGKINDVVWTCMMFAILGVGLLMTILNKGFQFTHFKHWWMNSIGSVFTGKDARVSDDEKSISQFQSLCTAMAATVGTGNIVGVATAIVSGGPGAIFWMWVAAILGLMTNFSENVLGIYYRRRNEQGEWSGGAMYYLKDGLGGIKGFKQIGSFLATIFAIFAVLASFGIGNMSQINSIVTNVNTTVSGLGVHDFMLFGKFSMVNVIAGFVLMCVAALVIVGGLQRIAQTTEKLVPFMAVLYIIGALVLIIVDYDKIIPAVVSIFSFAFTGRAVAGGTLGTVIRWGLKRGVFSNEAGLGSSVMVHSNSNVKEPVIQGIWGIFEVFADTIIICTLTALAILTSGYMDLTNGKVMGDVAPSALTSLCFTEKFGNAGAVFITLALILFAFSTCLGWSHYGTKSWEYLLGTKSTMIYRVAFIACIMLASLMTSSLAWDISDTFNGLMALPNLIGVVACSGTVAAIVKNYKKRVFENEDIEPMYNFDPDTQKEELQR